MYAARLVTEARSIQAVYKRKFSRKKHSFHFSSLRFRCGSIFQGFSFSLKVDSPCRNGPHQTNCPQIHGPRQGAAQGSGPQIRTGHRRRHQGAPSLSSRFVSSWKKIEKKLKIQVRHSMIFFSCNYWINQSINQSINRNVHGIPAQHPRNSKHSRTRLRTAHSDSK